ncbi:MAG TPA: phosphocholine cytidylyltransferase family protein [Xanthomonadales bacterium]|nr:phosphocholine cytidylyltransferase family protein [Xanthomonadales bacterium]
MRAIILAAGRGSRLEEHNPQRRPKCLMEFGGRSLLERHLDLLQQLKIRSVDLVVGYEADQIIEHVAKLLVRPQVAYHFNPRFQQGSVISLWAAQDSLLQGSDILLMDADVLYHPDILKRLVESKKPDCYLLDREFVPGDEPVKIAVRDGQMVEFRKRLDAGLEYDFLGESVGFFRFSAATGARLAGECARFDAEGLADAPHEEALRNLLLQNPGAFGYEDVSGLPWIEIDFPEDVVRASEQVLPAIRKDFAGF